MKATITGTHDRSTSEEKLHIFSMPKVKYGVSPGNGASAQPIPNEVTPTRVTLPLTVATRGPETTLFNVQEIEKKSFESHCCKSDIFYLIQVKLGPVELVSRPPMV
jgi:hypothetical protein